MTLATLLVLATATWASAQTTAPEEVMFHWGRVHLGTGQALVLNLELTDHFGGPLTLPVELQLEDKDGNVIYRSSIELSDGPLTVYDFELGIRPLSDLSTTRFNPASR